MSKNIFYIPTTSTVNNPHANTRCPTNKMQNTRLETSFTTNMTNKQKHQLKGGLYFKWLNEKQTKC